MYSFADARSNFAARPPAFMPSISSSVPIADRASARIFDALPERGGCLMQQEMALASEQIANV
jgi:hypothetical protein